jgi:hypothetical protein
LSELPIEFQFEDKAVGENENKKAPRLIQLLQNKRIEGSDISVVVNSLFLKKDSKTGKLTFNDSVALLVRKTDKNVKSVTAKTENLVDLSDCKDFENY